MSSVHLGWFDSSAARSSETYSVLRSLVLGMNIQRVLPNLSAKAEMSSWSVSNVSGILALPRWPVVRAFIAVFLSFMAWRQILVVASASPMPRAFPCDSSERRRAARALILGEEMSS